MVLIFLSDLRNSRTGTSLHAVCCKEAYERARYLSEECLTVTPAAVLVAKNKNEHTSSQISSVLCEDTVVHCAAPQQNALPLSEVKAALFKHCEALPQTTSPSKCCKQMEFHGGKAEMKMGKS